MKSSESYLKELTAKNNKGLTEKLLGSVVGIAGCGGLGSNIAVALTRIGIKKLVIVDFDKVELSNLNRQYYFVEDLGKNKVDALYDILKRINPYVELEKHCVTLNRENLPSIFKEASIVAEAFDTVSAKSMIIDSFLECDNKNRYLVCASGLTGINSSNLISTRKLTSNIYISGDFVSEPNEVEGLMAPRVNIAVGHQANMIVRLIDGVVEP
ncbi:MAG TPA: sulfur carrier protein ThiS adenylyltransferase ThiF [Victivallales bacterium]|nr:sulfur carrier protein ThiS adenylyltransferase ThiF [Victivallales bacterium]